MTHRSHRTPWLAALLAAAAAFAPRAEAGDDAVPLAAARRGAFPAPDTDPFLGVVLEDGSDAAVVSRVVPGSAADAAGLVAGDVLASADGAPLTGADVLQRVLLERGPGAAVRFRLTRAGRTLTTSVTLGARRRADECFRGSRFALAVVPLRFAGDTAPPLSADALDRLLFEPTGREGAGASLADYYRVQSAGRLTVTGRVLDPVVLPLPRARYAAQPMGGAPGSAFATAAEILETREADALRSFDGIAFLYTGAPETRASFALWPHRSNVTVASRRLPYYVHGLGAPDAATIGVHCHEFGHLLGLPDAYGTGHVTGSGDFCVMSIGHRGGGATGARAPFSLCGVCRVRLGFADPVILDPRVPQRLRLASPGDVAVVPLSAQTDEYLLLETRVRRGFDAELPSAGLLVWHVGGPATPGQGAYGNYADLIEAHGIDCVDASLVRTGEIAFPTARVRDLTPRTVPSVRSGAPRFGAWITDIDRALGGAVDLTIGVARDVVQRPPSVRADEVTGSDGAVERIDPVTGATVRLFVGPPQTGPVPPPSPPEAGEERK